MTIGDLIVRVGAQIDGFKSAMGEVSSSLNATATKMASVGTAMTAAITLPLVGVGIAALKTAGELEQNTIAFKTLLGSAEKARVHLEALRDFAAKTPFQFTDLVTASKRMQALGFEAKDVLPTLRSVGDAASALGMGADGIQRIVTALGQMKAKGTVQAEEMRQLAEAGIPAWNILAKTLNTDVAGAMKLVEKRAVDAATAIPAILAGMNEKFGGLMAQQAKTLLGQWSDLKDQITFTLTDIGTALMPIAKTMMENVLRPALATLKELATGFTNLPQPIQTLVLGFTGFVAIAGPALLIVGKLVTVVTSLGSIITTVLVPALAGPAGIIALIGIGLVGAAFAAYQSFQQLESGFRSMDEAFQKFITKQVEGAKTADQLAKAGENVKAAMDAGALSAKDGAKALEMIAQKEKALVGSGMNEMLGDRAVKLTIVDGAQKKTAISAEQLKEAFGNLGIKDLKTDIADAVKSFQMLAVAGALTSGQMMAAAMHIAKLRTELAELGRQKVDLVSISPSMPSLGDLQNLPAGGRMGASLSDLFSLPQMSAISRGIDMVTEALFRQANEAGVAARNAGYLTDAYHYFGIKTPQELEDVARKSEEQWEIMRADGEATPEAIHVAWERMFRDQIAMQLATGKITKAQYDDLVAQIGGSTTKVRQHVWSASEDMQRAMSSAFEGTYRALAKSIVDWEDWGKNLKNVVLDLAENMLSIMLKAFFKPIEDAAVKLAGNLGKTLGGIFGGGGGTPSPTGGNTPSVPGVGGAGGAASAASGWMGAVNMVSGAVSAISAVIGNFQMHGMNEALNSIGEHTLRIFNVAFQSLDEQYQFKGQLFAKMDDMWRTSLNTYDLLGKGLNVSTGGGGGITSVTFNVQASDPKAVVEEVARYLKLQGVYV